ncbi:MAG: ribosome assembly cofactor RimP, partial [Flavobacteriales bacterium]
MVLDRLHIEEILHDKLAELNVFLVDVQVSATGKITIMADSDKGISITELETINRYVNQALDKENNDFELTVSSPGMDQPFKVVNQYQKNVGKRVSVKLKDGNKLEGILSNLTEAGFELHDKVKQKKEGSKKKEWEETRVRVLFTDIKETKKII